MQYSYLIVDDDETAIANTLQQCAGFEDFLCVGIAKNQREAVNKILELKPNLVFMEIDSGVPESDLSLSIISQLSEYLNELPYFVILTSTEIHAFAAIKKGGSDYILKPLDVYELRKCLLRFQKRNPIKESESICIKSYGDYQFINLNDICYLKADNNTTDIHLKFGKKISAFKTLKYFENTLPIYFIRIHNSYIVNINCVSRIHLGKLKCYLNDAAVGLPFSKSYKENVDAIIRRISS